MIDSNADPTLIGAHSIDPIGNRLAQFLIGKIMNQGLFRSCLGTPLLAVVAEVSDQFLLLSVHGNDRASLFQQPLGLSIDMLKLSVAIRMIAPFDGLGVALQTVFHLMEKISHLSFSHTEALSLHFFRPLPL